MTDTGIIANTDAWLEARKPYLSASDLGAVLGVNKWRSWEEVKGGAERQFTEEELERFAAGHVFEDGLKKMWAMHGEGRAVSPAESTLWTYEDKLAATPDGMGLDENGKPCLIEAKCVGHRVMGHWAEGPPLYVLVQVQAQLICTGYDICYVVAALGGPGYKEWRIEADEVLQALIIDASDAYMHDKPSEDVQTKWIRRLHEMGYEQPPEKSWPIGEPGLVANAELSLVDRLNRAWLAREAAKEEYEEAVKEAQLLMKGAEFLSYGDRVVATWKTSARNGYDWKKLEAMVGGREALNEARKPSTVRTFLVKPMVTETDESNIW